MGPSSTSHPSPPQAHGELGRDGIPEVHVGGIESRLGPDARDLEIADEDGGDLRLLAEGPRQHRGVGARRKLPQQGVRPGQLEELEASLAREDRLREALGRVDEIEDLTELTRRARS